MQSQEQQLLEQLQTKDRHRLRRRWRQAKNAAQRKQVLQQLRASAEQTQARLAARGEISLMPDLPVTQRADEVAEAIKNNQVVIVCGETGSGKTTQLPKILLQAGIGARGVIGHTQPRRLAARSVAQRIADELDTPFGGLVGFKTRFSAQISEDTQVKLMTDGILLAETARDRFLNQYEAIIIDEAHERTLNIDFLLGYLKRLLPKRPDLKIIVTSATIDPERFSKFFNDAPIINVEGRGYPVTVEYQPPEENTESVIAIERAVKDLWQRAAGDILVFLSGERDIRDTERHLSKALAHSRYANAEVVPLYARLTRSAQNKIFTPSNGRRVVLSTNVAETSLTVPGIYYVIDTGLARISRYSTAARIQRLPIEPVSQASCNQRAGRCGRVAPGTCIRLFSEDDFNERPEFTDPEIRRTNLANVLLTMADLRLGDIDHFPFIEPPHHRYIRDGRNLLTQLQALDDKQRITPLGRKLARLPLDPRIGRMLVAGDEQNLLPALRVIAAGLTIQDPRERPAEARAAADSAHGQFRDKESDFVTLLKLWDAYSQVKSKQSGSQLRKWCRTHFVNFMRMREWEDLVRQLRQIGHQVGLSKQLQKGQLAGCDYEKLHRALLTGLLDQFGRLDESAKAEKGTYLGARGRKYKIFPGSGVFKKPPRWIVAGQLIETSRLYAHTVAKIEPPWLEAAARHLLKHEYYEPHWSKRRGHAAVRVRTKLFGQTLSDGQRADYGRVDPAAAREIFIQDGLVANAVLDRRGKPFEFLRHNQQIIQKISAEEARFRRRDLLVDELTRMRFYEQAVPAEVLDRKTLERWIKKHGDKALRFDEASLRLNAGIDLPEQAFPKTLTIGTTAVPLSYQFQPGKKQDGVTLKVPLALLNQLSTDRADWLIPGLLEEKITEILKALPKKLRRRVVPVPDYARACVERLEFAQGNLFAEIRKIIQQINQLEIPADAWADYTPSPHLILRFAVVDAQGKQLALGADVEALKQQFGQQATGTLQQLEKAETTQETGLTDWPQTPLDKQVELKHAGVSIKTQPVLVDCGDSVSVKLIDDLEQAAQIHRQGVHRLLQLKLRKQIKMVVRDLDGLKLLAVRKWPAAPQNVPLQPSILQGILDDSQPSLIADLLYVIMQAQIKQVPTQPQAFEQILTTLKKTLVADAHKLWQQVKPALVAANQVQKRLDKGLPLTAMAAVKDIKSQLQGLVFAGFMSQMRQPLTSTKHIQRYIKAILVRLDKISAEGSAADKQRQQLIAPYMQHYAKLVQKYSRQPWPEGLVDLRWLIEEYRVQVYAQSLGTAVKVSPKRLDKLIASLK